MNIETLFSFLFSNLILSFALFIGYLLLQLRSTARDRFIYLRLCFVSLVLLPFVHIPILRHVPLPDVAPANAELVNLVSVSPTRVLSESISLVVLLYGVGVALMVSRIAYSYANFLWLFRAHCEKTLPDGKRIFLHDRPLSPFSFGVLRPRIYIHNSLFCELSGEERAIVVQHEAMHCRRYDPAWLLLSSCSRAVFFCNPFVWFLYKKFHEDMEFSVDEELSKRVSAKAYGNLLLKLNEEEFLFPGVFLSSFIARRIEMMILEKKRSKGFLTFFCFAAFCFVGATLGYAKGEQNKATQAQMRTQALLLAPVTGQDAVQRNAPILNGDDFESASFDSKCKMRCAISIAMTPSGAHKLEDYTGQNIGKKIAIVVRGRVISTPLIREKIGGPKSDRRLQLTGDYSYEQAKALVSVINSIN